MTDRPARVQRQVTSGDASPIGLVLARLKSNGYEPKASGNGQWKSQCPAHQGKSENLSIKESSDGSVLLHCHHAANGIETCSAEKITAALGLELRDLFKPGSVQDRNASSPRASGPRQRKGKPWRSPAEAIDFIAGKEAARVSKLGPWVYNGPDGQESMRIYRLDKKDGGKQFRPVHPADGAWFLGDPPGRLPLYRLDELVKADVVYVTEGEKCADLTRELGLVATTSSHGSKSASKTDWSPLAGKTIIFLPDRDVAGEGYVDVACGIVSQLDPAPIIKVVRLPIDGDGDIEQWLCDVLPNEWSSARCRAELERLAAEEHPWEPSASAAIAGDDAEGKDVVDPVGLVDPAAFHGPLGKLVLATQPQTEANALFVLVHLMVFFGSSADRGPNFVLGPIQHLNLFVGLVGPTGKARKGTAGHVAKEIWKKVDPMFAEENIASGLNSGAGLLFNLRDPSTKPSRKGEEDEGVKDKRRVFLESELSSAFMQGHRESDPLLCFLRQFFDGDWTVRSNTKDPCKVTGGHVSIVGHCTPSDLEIHLGDVDKGNGTANRFLWIWGVRSKRQVNGDIYSLLDNFLEPELDALRKAIEFAPTVGRMQLAAGQNARWEKEYAELDLAAPGKIGEFYVRAPVMVLRMAAIFALADLKNQIEGPHLDAALAIWKHSERTLRWIFRGDVDPRAEQLIGALKATAKGLTKREIIHDVFRRNFTGQLLDSLLERLLAHQTIVLIKEGPKGGRPAARYKLKQW